MTNTQVRKAAEAKVKDGMGRQEAFDALKLEGTGMDDEKLARIVRYVPSLVARHHYRAAHAVLLVLLWITAVAKSLAGLQMAIEQGWSRLPAVILLPAITIILSVLIAMYRTRSYHTIAFLSALGLIRFSLRMDWANFDPWNSIDLVVAVAMIALSWYLFTKMASNYEVVPSGDGGKKVVFPPEPDILQG